MAPVGFWNWFRRFNAVESDEEGVLVVIDLIEAALLNMERWRCLVYTVVGARERSRGV